jgi:hypothetical protein
VRRLAPKAFAAGARKGGKPRTVGLPKGIHRWSARKGTRLFSFGATVTVAFDDDWLRMMQETIQMPTIL